MNVYLIRKSFDSSVLKNISIAVLVMFIMPFAASGAGPLCTEKNLDMGNIEKFSCDRFQSKGDLDTITPQIVIVKPVYDQEISLASLDTNAMDQKLLPVTIFISPEYVVDFGGASNAGTQYAMLAQVDGVGHAHLYVGPVTQFITNMAGEVTDVIFLANTRSDQVGGFCVFQSSVPVPSGNQMLSVNCPLQGNPEPGRYRVIADVTENSHGPRIKGHPRILPPGHEIEIDFVP